jgi:hypothetical protein
MQRSNFLAMPRLNFSKILMAASKTMSAKSKILVMDLLQR